MTVNFGSVFYSSKTLFVILINTCFCLLRSFIDSSSTIVQEFTRLRVQNSHEVSRLCFRNLRSYVEKEDGSTV